MRRSRNLLGLAAVILALTAAPSLAQVAPYVHGATIGTSPVQALPTNPLRKKIWLYNSNATATIAFCPAGPNRDTGAAVTCAVNGAGSITLSPLTGIWLDGALPNGQPLSMASAWNVVASAGSSTYTIIELE